MKPFSRSVRTDLLSTPLRVLTMLCCVIGMTAVASSPLWAQAETPETPPATTEEPPPQDDPVFKLEGMQVPTVEELLKGKALDWVVMTTDEVFVVDSIVPRPQTLEKRKLEVEAKNLERQKAPAEDRPRIIEELEELKFLYVSLPDVAGNPERRISIPLIKELVHHEDLMLRRIQLLLDEKNVQQAFELLLRLEQDWESWPGLDAMHNQFLLVDGVVRLEAQKPSEALTVLRELQSRDKTFSGLSQRYGEAIDALVVQAVAADDYRRATFHLDELVAKFPAHPVFLKYEAQFTAQVQQLITAADAAAAAGDYRTATINVEEGARIWPRTAALLAAFRKHAARYQRLHVGVTNLPGAGAAYFLPTPADIRVRSLTTISLFEVDRLRDGTAYYRTRFLDEWEPYDLGRRMKFTLRQFRQPSDMHNVIGSPDVVTQLLRRITPTHADYDERLASYIESISVHSPLEFTIEFKRVPPRIEPLLAAIRFVGESSETEMVVAAGGEQESDSALADPTLIGPLANVGGFIPLPAAKQQFALGRAIPEPDGLPAYHVAEVVEHRFENAEQAVQALSRGEVSMLPELPDWVIRRMQEDDVFLQSYHVQPLGMPVTQILQFNPQSKPLRSRELRRGMAYAVDRERLLREIVLQDEKLQHGRLVTSPFFSNSPARHVLVEADRYDISSAIAMVVAAKKILTASKTIQAEQLPKLRFVVEPNPISEAAANEMARIWNRIGVPVDVVLGTDEDTGEWDLMFRSLQMSEPLVEIWPFLTVSERAQVSDLDHYPDWLKQEIVDLDRTSDQSRALTRMQELHRHLAMDAALVPLWELDKFQVLRKTILGVPARPLYSYDNLDHWSSDPWYPAQ